MNEPFYAGYLCATHVGELLRFEGETGWYRLRRVIHSENQPCVRIIVSPECERHQMCMDLDPRTIMETK